MTTYQTHDNDAMALNRADELHKATVVVAENGRAAHLTDGEIDQAFDIDELRVNGMPCNMIVTTEGHIEPTDGVLKI